MRLDQPELLRERLAFLMSIQDDRILDEFDQVAQSFAEWKRDEMLCRDYEEREWGRLVIENDLPF